MEDQIIKDTRRQVWSTNKQGNITKGEKKSIKGKVDFKKGFKENKPVKKSVFDRLGLITETNNNTNINFKKNVFQTGRDKGQAFLNKHKLNQARYENVEENDLTGIIDGVSADEDLDGMRPDDFGSNDMESDGNGVEDTEIDDMRSDDVDNDGNGVAEYDSENILEGIEEALYDSDEEDGYGYKKNSRNDIKPIKEFAAGESVLSNAMKARRKTVEERIYEEKLRQENMKELDKLKEERLLKMKHYIKKGFMADPEKKMDINEAISLTPDCYKMCPEFEKAERKFENSVDKFEKEPYELVKKYTRSAAGVHIIMPCDVRTPETLLETTRYLIDKIVNNDKYTFYETHSFVRDRLRAIGKDFIVQHHNGPIAVEVYEMISRFYILSIHELSKVNKWDEIPEERNQLKAALSNLVEQYEMLRKKGIVCTNEHEFQSYIELNNLFIIKSAYNFKQTNSTFKYDSNRKETKLVNKVKSLLQKAKGNLNEFNIRSFNDDVLLVFEEFFDYVFKLESEYFLFGCVIETHFQSIRRLMMLAIKLINKDNDQVIYTTQSLKDLLHFDDWELFKEFLNYCNIKNINTENGPQENIILKLNGSDLITIKSPSESIPTLTKVIFCTNIDEIKRDNDYKSIIYGLLNKAIKINQSVHNNNNDLNLSYSNNSNNFNTSKRNSQNDDINFSFIKGKVISNNTEEQNLDLDHSIVSVKEKEEKEGNKEFESKLEQLDQEINELNQTVSQLNSEFQELVNTKKEIEFLEVSRFEQKKRYQEYLDLKQSHMQKEGLMKQKELANESGKSNINKLIEEIHGSVKELEKGNRDEGFIIKEYELHKLHKRENKLKLRRKKEERKIRELERIRIEKEQEEQEEIDGLTNELTEGVISEYVDNCINDYLKKALHQEAIKKVLYSNLLQSYVDDLVVGEIIKQTRNQNLIKKNFRRWRLKTYFSSKNMQSDRKLQIGLELKSAPSKVRTELPKIVRDATVNWDDYTEYKEGMSTSDILARMVTKSRESTLLRTMEKQ